MFIALDEFGGGMLRHRFRNENSSDKVLLSQSSGDARCNAHITLFDESPELTGNGTRRRSLTPKLAHHLFGHDTASFHQSPCVKSPTSGANWRIQKAART